MNALKSGIHAKSLILPSEELADLEQLIDDYYQRHNPDSPEACFYLDEVIHCEWLLRRYRTAETQMWKYETESSFSIEQKEPPRKVCRRRLEPLLQTPVPRRCHPPRLPPRPQSPQGTQGRSRRPNAPAGRRPSRSPIRKPLTPNHFTRKLASFRHLPLPHRPSLWNPSPTGQYPSLPPSHPSTPPLGAVDGCFGRVLR